MTNTCIANHRLILASATTNDEARAMSRQMAADGCRPQFINGQRFLRWDASLRPSSPEEHEPDDPEHQYPKPGRDREQGKHGRPRLGLACLGRGFNDPALLFCCHGALDC